MFARFRTFALAGLAGAALLAPLPAAAQADEEPLARFEDALCPGVVGLKQEAAETMVGRMRANAEMLGLRHGRERRLRGQLHRRLRRRRAGVPVASCEDRSSYIFAEMTREERVALLADPGPARAMLRVRARSRDGMPISRRENLDRPAADLDVDGAFEDLQRDPQRHPLGDGAVRPRCDPRPEPRPAGRLRDLPRAGAPPARPGGRPGRPRSSRCSTAASARPAGLTEFDRAYLGQLYTGLANLPAPAKLADLAEATGVDTVE